ncbi:DUF3352 domain-containing protein [Microtetraspora niveoalba]|uniref:DUF3352 domain-containing protein n=1 Tax=Microtetraspora niveoalba TaxID=46175 RepID=UPI0008334847|nr:DUF3352 domain-containing protein [Microtetraspora niveoalba]
MPADIPPFPQGQDPDRTIAYRTPQPPSQPQPHDDGRTRQWPYPEELGPPAPPGPPATGKRGGGRGWIIALVAAVLVGVVGGGGVWAASVLSGGGTQPHEVLPGNAAAYLRLDLDPAANQKLALLGIARKFSATKESFAGDDPRAAVFETLREEADDLAEVDYARDVEPWLGDRIGIAVFRSQSEYPLIPQTAIAVQVKDEAAARAGLAKLLGDSGPLTPRGIAFRDGYAILGHTQADADGYAKAAPLSENERFAGDMDALGEPGVLSFWADLSATTLNSGDAEDRAATELVRDARLAGALRFGDDYAELTGVVRGMDLKQAETAPVKLGELPASTAAAFGVSGLGDLLRDQWAKLQKAAEGTSDGRALTQTGERYGLTLPDDLVTLFGESVTMAVDREGLDGDQPKGGVVLRTDPAKAREVLAKLEGSAAEGGVAPQLVKVDGDGMLVVATSEDYAKTLSAPGTLGDDETFQRAVPGADDATFGLYADLDRFEDFYLGDLKGEDRADLEVLRAVGLSGRLAGENAGFTLRVLFD